MPPSKLKTRKTRENRRQLSGKNRRCKISTVAHGSSQPVSLLSKGVYTLAEAAKYTGVNPATLRAWFLPRSDRGGKGPVFQSDHARVNGDFAISFFNLIEAYVASFFRKHHVSHTDIRLTNQTLKAQLKVDHPFAHAQLSTAIGKIVLEKRADDRFVEVLSRQLLFPEFSQGLHRLRYNELTQLADSWELSKGIVVNPKLGFGKPVVGSTGISTLLVAKQYKANGKDSSLVARLFKIPKDSVELAFHFERGLGRIAI